VESKRTGMCLTPEPEMRRPDQRKRGKRAKTVHTIITQEGKHINKGKPLYSAWEGFGTDQSKKTKGVVSRLQGEESYGSHLGNPEESAP